MASNIGGFTPGPWSAMSWSATEHYIPEVWNKDESGISDSIAKLEDARLIAAAPELLEVLVKCRRALATVWGEDEKRLHEIDAAIAKATGAQP